MYAVDGYQFWVRALAASDARLLEPMWRARLAIPELCSAACSGQGTPAPRPERSARALPQGTPLWSIWPHALPLSACHSQDAATVQAPLTVDSLLLTLLPRSRALDSQ